MKLILNKIKKIVLWFDINNPNNFDLFAVRFFIAYLALSFAFVSALVGMTHAGAYIENYLFGEDEKSYEGVFLQKNLTDDYATSIKNNSEAIEIARYLEEEKLNKYRDLVNAEITFNKNIDRIKSVLSKIKTDDLIVRLSGEVNETAFRNILFLHGRMKYLKKSNMSNLALKINTHEVIKRLLREGRLDILLDLEP